MSDLFCAASFVIARHAEATFVDEVFSDEGGTLSREGRRQAAALADSLTGARISAIFSSDLARAVQTAEIVAARVGAAVVTTTKALREVDVGDLVGESFDQERIESVARQWRSGDLDVRFPGGESGAEVVARHRDQFQEIADLHRGESVLVVGHETALGISVPALAGLPLDWAGGERWDNAGTVRLELDADGYRLG